MRKIRVVTIIPTLDTGGAEKLALDLVSFVDKRNFDPIIICLFPKRNTIYEAVAKDRGIDIIHLNKRPGVDISVFFELWKTLQLIKPDIIHTHIYTTTYVLPWMSLHNHVKWVHTVHSIATKELYSFHKPIMSYVYSKYPRFYPVAISKSVKQSMIEHYNTHEDKIRLIHNGIDLKRFVPAGANENREMEKIEFICVARFNEVKNHKLLLSAFSEALDQIPNILLTLVGDGEKRHEIEEMILKLNIVNNVNIIGETDNVTKYLNHADVFILASKYEGLPLSILEGMAAGLPVIATDVGGVPDIIANGINGILVESENVAKLTGAIIRMALDSSFRQQVSIRNKDDIRKFDISIIAQQYEKLYYFS